MAGSSDARRLQSATVAGGVAGNLTVTGIKPGAQLVTVVDVAAAGENLASEFKVTAADTINNTGGTDTTDMVLLVQWLPQGDRYGE